MESDLAIIFLLGLLVGIGTMLPAIVMARQTPAAPAEPPREVDPTLDADWWKTGGSPPAWGE